MSPQSQIELTLPILLSPIVVAIVMIGLCSVLKEPHRQQFSAIFLAGAGAAYLSGGFSLWEFGFCAIITLLAYLGLQHYKAIAIGWGLHTSWDMAHHYEGGGENVRPVTGVDRVPVRRVMRDDHGRAGERLGQRFDQKALRGTVHYQGLLGPEAQPRGHPVAGSPGSRGD